MSVITKVGIAARVFYGSLRGFTAQHSRRFLAGAFLACTSAASVAGTIAPASITLPENATQQFAASVSSTWSVTCGSITSTGYYTAPLHPSTACSVTATPVGGGSAVSAAVTVVSPIVLTPASAETPQGSTQQFSANVPVTWVVSCGSMTAGGVFTATAAVNTHCTVEGIATGAVKYTVYGYDTVGQPVGFTLLPANPSVLEGATQQFTASGAATFTASCGSISTTGLYTAPLAPASCTVTATNQAGTATAKTTATVTAPFTVLPATASTPQNLTQQFSASVPVTWSSSCGSISTAGLFTPSGSVGQVCTIQAVASGASAYTNFATDTIAAAASTFTVSPTSATVTEAATQQFTASSAATWISTCGTITPAGLYTAPVYATTSCAVTATETGSKSTASAAVTVVTPILINPLAPTTPQGSPQQFTANMPVSWVAACGSINAAGLYIASATKGSRCTIEAVATTTPKYTAYSYDIVAAPLSYVVVWPTTATTSRGLTQQFAANYPATWSASCGSISATGLFTASASAGSTCTVTATAVSNTSLTASASDMIGTPLPLAVAPANPSLAENATLAFTSGAPASWSTTCGSINATTGIFTAPVAQETCTVTATATDGTARVASTQVNVALLNYTTYRGNNLRTGAQTQEFLLTPSNVNASQFGPAWSTLLDSGIWTQPLYMNALMINGALHNVVFETTANDSVYALDGDTGAILWRSNFLSPGVVPVQGSLVGIGMNPVGIVGTPVIDPVAGTLYVIAMTAEQNNTVLVHRLHALNLLTGQEQPNSPAVITAPGFVDADELQRPGLLLANGTIYAAFGSYNDVLPYQGFVLAFNSTTLALQASFNDDPKEAPTEGGGGIWMSGTGPASDANGNVFVVSGNGFADGVNNFGQSTIKLSPSLQVMDYFTPYDHDPLSVEDVDLGSGGALLLPDQTGAFAHEMIVCGKTPSIFVLNRDSMGGIGSTSDSIIQRVDGQIGQAGNFRDSGHPCFSTPAYWNQNVYIVPNHDVMKMFTLDPVSGLLSTAPVSVGSFTYSWPGAFATISANGNSNGIVWTYDFTTGTLRATDAGNVANELYVATTYTSTKWSVPTVINGHVYVESQNRVFAYGLK